MFEPCQNIVVDTADWLTSRKQTTSPQWPRKDDEGIIAAPRKDLRVIGYCLSLELLIRYICCVDKRCSPMHVFSVSVTATSGREAGHSTGVFRRLSSDSDPEKPTTHEGKQQAVMRSLDPDEPVHETRKVTWKFQLAF